MFFLHTTFHLAEFQNAEDLQEKIDPTTLKAIKSIMLVLGNQHLPDHCVDNPPEFTKGLLFGVPLPSLDHVHVRFGRVGVYPITHRHYYLQEDGWDFTTTKEWLPMRRIS